MTVAFRRPRLLFFAFLSFYAAAFLLAQNGDEDEGDRITALSVTGLRRTSRSTAERPLRKFIGMEAGELDPDEVRAAIMNTGFLEPLSVEIEDQILSVKVREKWSIFPIPVFMANSEGIMAGLAFFDANAFGWGDKFFIAGLYQTDAWAATVGYLHNSPEERLPGWNVMAAFTRGERHDRNQNNEELRRFELDSISAGAGLNFPLLKDTDLLSAAVTVSYNEKNLRKKESAQNAPDEDLRLFGASTELSARKSSWDGYLLSQESASLRYSYRTTFNGFSYQSVRFRGTWEKSLVPGFRLNLRTGFVYEPEAPILFESSPFAVQVAILPRDFSARNYAGASAGLEKYIFKISAGTLSLAAAYQVVYSQGSVLEDSLDHGCQGMLTFYLNRIAIPALGLGIAYNVREKYLQGSFALGMTF